MFDREEFIEQLLIKANPDIDDNGLDMLIEDVEPVLIDRIMTNIISKLTEEQLQWFNDIVEEHGINEKISEYLKTIIPDYENFVTNVYGEFEDMYLEEFSNFEKEFPVDEQNKE